MPLRNHTLKENMFDKSGKWIYLDTVEDFDNGLSDLIGIWSSADLAVTQELKDSALTHFKENLEGALLNWADNKAKTRKYTAIATELAEFEEALKAG
jgi:hypothetical protein